MEPDAPLQEGTLFQAPEDQLQAKTLSRGREEFTIPGYSLAALLGAGTFGEVWAGQQTRTGQKVAIKLFTHPGGLDWQYFRHEVERLRDVAEHPYVVTLLDADLGHEPPYLVMPLLAGGSLSDRVSSQARPPAEEVARWLEQIAEALRYIHSKGLLHCDLKPVNVLLDAEGRARLLDFGQALQRGEGCSALGTLGYMAPEQVKVALGQEGAPDPRWDVYALGATAYYLLTGRPPRLPPDARGRLEQMTQATERLSYYATTLETTPLDAARSLNPRVDRDLAVIVESCLELAPERRPGSAAEVLEDLARRRDRRPLLCRRPWPVSYLAGRFLLRQGAMVIEAAVFVAVILFVFWLGDSKLKQALGQVEGRRNQVAAARSEPTPAPQAVESPAEESGLDAVARHLAAADAEALLPEDKRGEGPVYPWTLRWARAGSDQLRSADFNPAGALVALSFWDGRVQLLRASTGRAYEPAGGRSLSCAAFGPRHLVAGTPEGELAVWDSRGQPVGSPPSHPGAVVSAELAPDGRTVATASRDGTVRAWDLVTGRPVWELDTETPCWWAAPDPGGRRLVTVTAPGRVQLWDRGRPGGPGRSLAKTFASPAWRARFSFDGRQILVDLLDGTRWVWTPGGEKTWLAADPDGFLAFADGALWGTWSGRRLLQVPTGQWKSASVSPGGERILLNGSRVLIYDTFSGATLGELPARIRASSFSRDGSRLAVTGGAAEVRVYPLAALQEEPVVLAHESHLVAMTFSSDGRALLTATREGAVRLWSRSLPIGRAPDLDLPGEIVKLEAELATGARRSGPGQVSALTPAQWQARRRIRSELLLEHASTCRFPGAARWREEL